MVKVRHCLYVLLSLDLELSGIMLADMYPHRVQVVGGMKSVCGDAADVVTVSRSRHEKKPTPATSSV